MYDDYKLNNRKNDGTCGEMKIFSIHFHCKTNEIKNANEQIKFEFGK